MQKSQLRDSWHVRIGRILLLLVAIYTVYRLIKKIRRAIMLNDVTRKVEEVDFSNGILRGIKSALSARRERQKP